MNRRILAIIVSCTAIASFFTGMAIGSLTDHDSTPTHSHSRNCEEDMPCWNCKTMGNHQCGTPAAYGYNPSDPAANPEKGD